MKRHATTLVFLVLLIGLALFTWLDRNRVTEGERKQRENDVFVAWRKDDVSHIEIAHEGETVVLERQSGPEKTWRMAAPHAERVDQAAMERLLTTLEFASIVRKVGEAKGDEAHVLGFDAPRAHGSVRMGTLVFRFVLGGPSPRPEGSSYFRVDDGATVVVSKELTDALLAPSDTYRDRTVVPYLSLDLARFEVKRAGGGFTVERKDDRSFTVQGLIASRSALDKVWGALAEMRAEAFPKGDVPTGSPRLTIVMTPKEAGKAPGELVASGPCPGHPDDVLVLRTEPTRVLACAPKGAIEALEGIEPQMLVDKHPFAFRHDEMEEIRFEGSPAKPIQLARRGTGFHEREPEDRELSAPEADAVSELLARIEEGTAESVSAGGAAFEAVGRARVRSGEHEEVVEIGRLTAPTVTLRRVRDDARLVVSRAIARRLLPRATTLRSRSLLAETRRVSRVVLRCGTPQELVDHGSGLELVQPTGYETDGSITQLVSALTRGNVIAWVADADDGSFGFTADGCRVVLSFEDGNAPVTIRFGGEGEGGVYGTIEGRPEVFVAPLSMLELAKRIYVSHAALRVPAERIESVKVIADGHPVPDADRVAAAAGLFADRVVSLGPPDVGKVEVEIAIGSEGGAAKKVVCGAARSSASGTWRRCATPTVKAVFDVRASLVDALTK